MRFIDQPSHARPSSPRRGGPIRGAIILAGLYFLSSEGAAFADHHNDNKGVIYRVQGPRSSQLGFNLEKVGDVDGDGVPDFAASASGDDRIEPEGKPSRIEIRSGVDGSLIRDIFAPVGERLFARKMALFPDQDGDGVDELLIEASASPLRLSVASPSTGRFLYSVSSPSTTPSLKVLQDIDGDQVPEILIDDSFYDIEAPEFIESVGRFMAYSIAKDEVIWEQIGTREREQYGVRFSPVADQTGDGVRDVLLLSGNSREDHLRIILHDGKNGDLISQVFEFDFLLGLAQIESMGDLTGDGIDEIGIAGVLPREHVRSGRGQVHIFDGDSYNELYYFQGVDAAHLRVGFWGSWLGTRLGPLGDVDGDGQQDFYLVARHINSGLLPEIAHRSILELRSGVNGSLLTAFQGSVDFRDGVFFSSVSDLGDIDGDGRDEIILGSAYESPDEVNQLLLAGVVRAAEYDPALPTFVRGDADGDGEVEFQDGIRILRLALFGWEEHPCPQSLDFWGDENIEIADGLGLFFYFFGRAVAPKPPFPHCGRYGGFIEHLLPCHASTCE